MLSKLIKFDEKNYKKKEEEISIFQIISGNENKAGFLI
jgi:hypothetical protein